MPAPALTGSPILLAGHAAIATSSFDVKHSLDKRSYVYQNVFDAIPVWDDQAARIEGDGLTMAVSIVAVLMLETARFVA